MNVIYSEDQVRGKGFGKGFGLRLAAIALGVAFFLSASAGQALAQSAAMSQLEYLQWMVQLSGEKLGKKATAADYVAWAKARGLNPSSGWEPGTKLSKQVLAQTLAQLLNIAPRKKGGDYVSLLAQNGIHLPGGEKIKRTDFVDLFDSTSVLFGPARSLSPSHPGHQIGQGHENANGNANGHDHHDHDGDGFPDNPFPGQGTGGPHSLRR
jgi:hypothetical protein